MKKFLAAFIMMSALSLISATANAQTSWTFGEPYTILPMYEKVQGLLTKDGSIRCGKYFSMTNKVAEPTPGKYSLVSFVFLKGTDSAFMLMGWDKFIVYVDATKTVPTATYSGPLNRQDPIPFHWILKISEADLKGAQACLPKPTSKGELM